MGGTDAMHITKSKLLALLIAAVYVGLAARSEDARIDDILAMAGALLFPLALIWFPEALGSMTGYVGRGGYIDTETPPALVAAAGWFILVGLPVVAYWLAGWAL